MTSYSLPDITGSDPSYLQVNVPFFIYQNGIKLIFENTPVFRDSLVFKMTDGTNRTLDEDIDWTVQTDDIDMAAMGRAHIANPSFNKQLVRSVTIISNKAINSKVAVSYQAFYQVDPGRTFDDGIPIEITPDLIKQLVAGYGELRQQVSGVNSPVVPTTDTPALLPFDINKTISGNNVTDEIATVNTVIGAKVIRPKQGAYFADSLTLSYNGNTLNNGTDYLPIGYSPLTERSTNNGGIYQFILLNGEFTGDVSIDYHAVGGDVQRVDMEAIYQLMIGIKTFLNDGVFITSETITETPSFRAFHSRLLQLENNVRSLLSGQPNYGDATSGVTVTKGIQAIDANFHWYNVASLYQVAGSTDIITADQFKGRVYLPTSKVSFSFTVDVNLQQPRNKVSFKTDSVVFDPLYKLFTDISTAAPQYPMLRVVYGQSGSVFQGAWLQVGIPLTTNTDQLVVEDMSTTESCWILDRTGQIVSGQTVVPNTPKDSGFTLPDGSSIWSSAGSSSFSEVYVPKFDDGYLVYSGSTVKISDINTSDSTTSLFNSVLPSYFPISKVKSVTVTLSAATNDVVYDIEIPMTGTTTNQKFGRNLVPTVSGEIAEVSATLVQGVGGTNSTIGINLTDTNLSIWSSVSTSMTDIIRYIRVKV